MGVVWYIFGIGLVYVSFVQKNKKTTTPKTTLWISWKAWRIAFLAPELAQAMRVPKNAMFAGQAFTQTQTHRTKGVCASLATEASLAKIRIYQNTIR